MTGLAGGLNVGLADKADLGVSGINDCLVRIEALMYSVHRQELTFSRVGLNQRLLPIALNTSVSIFRTFSFVVLKQAAKFPE